MVGTKTGPDPLLLYHCFMGEGIDPNVNRARLLSPYGSCAKETVRPDSGIDVAVIVDKVYGDFLEAHTRLFRLRRDVDIRIEPVLVEASSDRCGFLKEILSTGCVVYQASRPSEKPDSPKCMLV